MRRLVFLCLAFTTISACYFGSRSLLRAEERTWTDISGQFNVEAEFAGLENGQVSLKKSDGDVVKVPLTRLSGPDQRWVARSRQKKRPAPAAPRASNITTTLVSSTKDWPRWRGPNNDGISGESGLLDSWTDDGPPVAWSSRGLGSGFSSVAIFDGKIITMGKKAGVTKLICVSSEEGSPIWDLDLGGGDNPNCTPTIDPETKFAYGISFDGVLICANIETGQEVWKVNFQSDFGGKMMSQWGYSESPLIDGENLICTPGSSQGVLAALNKRTGKVVWSTRMPGGTAGYASPVISHGGGVKQYVTLVGKGLIGVRATDGELLWHYPRIANGTANVPTPIVKNNFVFGSSGYNDGGSALIKLSPAGRGRVQAQEVYYKSNNEVQNHHGGMVLIGDHIYMGHGHNNGHPLCLHMMSGRVAWGPQRGPGRESAAIVAADGHLYFRYQNAVMALIEATPAGYNLKGSFQIKSKNGQSWAHPVIADKKLYLRDQDELHCYNIAG